MAAVGLDGAQALAQTNPNPGQGGINATVTALPPSCPTYIMTPEQRAREEGGRPPRECVLPWTVTNPSNFLYRVSYRDDDIGAESVALVNVIDNTNPEGNAEQSGSVTVTEEELLRRLGEVGLTRRGTLPVYILIYRPDPDPNDLNDPVVVDSWNFDYDLEAPAPPPVVEARPGERTMRVRWTRPQEANDLGAYEVRFCPSVSEDAIRMLRIGEIEPERVPGTSTVGYRLSMLPCGPESGLEVQSSIAETEDTLTLQEGIEEGSWVAFQVLAEDEAPFFNTTSTETSTTYAVRTEPGFDFFERNQMLGGEEDGGFCFVATAAYGSYAHPTVQWLRVFRDEVLAHLPFGRALTRLYYEASPPLAETIKGSPRLGRLTRAALVVVTLGLFTLVGAMFVVLIVMILRFGLWCALGRAARRLGARGPSSRGGTMGGIALFLAIPLAEGEAEAQSLRAQPKGDVGVAFEVKAGPYLPAIGEAPSEGGLVAWEEVYGDGRERVLVSIGGELQLARGSLGTVSVGGTVGFAAWQGRAQVRDANQFLVDGPRGSSTFNLVPMTLTLGFRLDSIMDRTPVPLAPYIRGGLAYSLWWNTRDDGSLSRVEAEGEEQLAIGGKLGVVGTVGIALALNAIDRGSAGSLYASTGIRTTYLFFEGQAGWVDGFGDPGFDLSDITWFAGLMLEL